MLPILFILLFLQNTQAETLLKSVTINGNAAITSTDFPKQIVTGNGVDVDLVDWLILSAIQGKLRAEFDTIDLDSSDNLYFCKEEEYRNCSNISCPCKGFDFWTTTQFWPPSNGPMIVAFRPGFPMNGSSPIRRIGYRATIFELDDTTTYFQCNSTVDISHQINPFYVISPGYPSLNEDPFACSIEIRSNSAIRLRIPVFNLLPDDSFTLTGLDLQYGNVSLDLSGFSDSKNATTTFYFRAKVVLDIQMSNASENTKNYYLLYAEPFLDNPSICDITNRNFLNKEFAISTFGYDSYSNYANNLNCSIVLEGLAVNSQAVLELFDLRMESGADFLQINDLNVKISSLDGNDRYYAYPLEQKSAALEISSDQLGSRVGVNAKMHILDCTCSGGVFDMRTPRNLSFSMPISAPNRTFSYCRGIECWWNFTMDTSQVLTLDLYRYDIDRDVPILYLDGQFWSGIYWTQPKNWFFNRSTVSIQFKPRASGFSRLDTGFDLLAITAPPQTTFIDLCMTSLAHVLMPQNTAFWQYQITSCKGRVSLVILDPFAGLYEVYDGEFDKGPRLSTNQGSVIVSSGRMLSLRLSLMQPQANPVYEFVASDSFTDQEGNICGGVIHYMFSDSTYNTFNLSSVEGCVLYVDKITAHIQTTAAVPVFPGCTLDKDKLIPSSKDVPLNLYVGWMAAPFTILIPANFSDEEQLLLNFEQEIWLSDSDSALVASSDYLQVDDQNMFKGGIVASIFYKGTQQQVLFFELLQALGDGQLVFGNESRKYSGHDGIFSRLIENGTQIVYNSTLTGKGRLIARVSTIEEPPTTTSTATSTTTDTDMSTVATVTTTSTTTSTTILPTTEVKRTTTTTAKRTTTTSTVTTRTTTKSISRSHLTLSFFALFYFINV